MNGAVKASINNTTLESGVLTELNFEPKQTPTSVTVTKGRHWVWIPAFTVSRLPGRWMEVGDDTRCAAEPPANHVLRVSAEELQREVHNFNAGDR